MLGVKLDHLPLATPSLRHVYSYIKFGISTPESKFKNRIQQYEKIVTSQVQINVNANHFFYVALPVCCTICLQQFGLDIFVSLNN